MGGRLQMHDGQSVILGVLLIAWFSNTGSNTGSNTPSPSPSPILSLPSPKETTTPLPPDGGTSEEGKA
jgi:hypothetical protein